MPETVMEKSGDFYGTLVKPLEKTAASRSAALLRRKPAVVAGAVHHLSA
jgi:hypothetical protein